MRFALILLLVVSTKSSYAFMAFPGSCGTQCMAQRSMWGTPFNAPLWYPYGPTPMNFYSMPTYWSMMPRWYTPMGGPGFFRGVSSEEEDEKK